MTQLLARWKLWALVALAFLLGVLGIRARWVSEGESKMRAKVAEQRRQAIREANEVRDEVEALDHDTLKQRASRWVRGPQR